MIPKVLNGSVHILFFGQIIWSEYDFKEFSDKLCAIPQLTWSGSNDQEASESARRENKRSSEFIPLMVL